MISKRHITIYTILGSLSFISKLHLRSIKDCADDQLKIVAFGGRSLEADREFIELLDTLHIEYKLFSREKHKFNTKCVDGNYDYLMNKVKPKDIFITMHDDCIIGKNSKIFSIVREKLERYEFCGKLENNKDMKEVCKKLNIKNISKYNHLIVKGKNMHDSRLGTWFLSGNFKAYKDNGLSLGEDMRLYNYISNILLNNYKFKLKRPFLKLDGGFNFNLKIHKRNIPFYILSDDINIKHLVHATNFFVKKGFYYGLGSAYEWNKRWDALYLEQKSNEVDNEKKFLIFLKDKLLSIKQPYLELNNLVEKLKL